jgi:tryptophan synthase alpha chain
MSMDLEEKLRELKGRGEGALMPHVYYGDPDAVFSRKLISIFSESGADIIELGIPFSDPTADGSIFQAACERALRGGITPLDCIAGLKQLREDGLEIPVVVTTYYNIPYVMGVGRFLEGIGAAGAQGLIVPNLPFEEAGPLIKEARRHGVHVILQVAPTTTEERLRRIAESASGFIYVMNVEGVTGTRKSLQLSTLTLIERVRKHTDLPILAGFGISNREQAASVVAAGADGVVSGSAFAKIYEESISDPTRALPEVSALVRELKAGCIEGCDMRGRVIADTDERMR